MTKRPLASELAAATWVLGGFVATLALMTATGDAHSITRGLRAHPLITGALLITAALHVYGPPATDPLHWAFKPVRTCLRRR